MCLQYSMTQQEFNRAIIAAQPTLKRFARSLTSNQDDVADLVQETYLKALKHRERLAHTDQLKAWLMTVMKNTFLSDYRHTRKFQSVDLTSTVAMAGGMTPEACYIAEELQNVIQSLPQLLRQPFQMFIDGYHYEEIAQYLQRPVGTIKSHIFKARYQIKFILNNKPIKPITMPD